MAGTISVVNAGPQGPAGVGGSLTTEQAVDATAGALVQGNKISISYDDPAGQISVAFNPESIEHDWPTDGWTPFTTIRINDDVPLGNEASQTLSVVNGRGRVTNTNTQPGMRKVYPRNNTLWMDSEIRTLCYGGTNGSTLPQGGHFHRGYFDGTGRWRGIAVNNNIFLTDANVVNANVWNMDPTEAPADQLDLGNNGGVKTYSPDRLIRQAAIVGVTRFNFGIWINEYRVTPGNANGLEVGDLVNADAVLDATFDISTPQAITGKGVGYIQMQDLDTAVAVTSKFELGSITPTSASGHLYWPYWICSRLIGSKLLVKVWRERDPEPDWSDSNAVFSCDFAGANAPGAGASYPDQPGYCGLIGNHIHDSGYFEYGHFSARRL